MGLHWGVVIAGSREPPSILGDSPVVYHLLLIYVTPSMAIFSSKGYNNNKNKNIDSFYLTQLTTFNQFFDIK